MTEPTRTIKIYEKTHPKLKIRAATTGETMMDLIERLIQQESNTMTYSRRQEIIEKIGATIYGKYLTEQDIERANLAGWTIDIRFADGQYISENNWSRVEGIHLTPEELEQAKQIASTLK